MDGKEMIDKIISVDEKAQKIFDEIIEQRNGLKLKNCKV